MNVMTVEAAVDDRAIARLIYEASMLCDTKDFKGWLDLCAADFTYAITAHSYEIRKDMCWLDLDREGMMNLVRMLPRHNTDQSNFTRHTTVYTIDRDGEGKASVTSAVTIYRTTLDGGTTSVYAVGKYRDTVDVSGPEPLFLRREVALDTRNLGIGTHYPL